jgi:hypothetical protein
MANFVFASRMWHETTTFPAAFVVVLVEPPPQPLRSS